MHFIALSSRMYVPCTCCLLVLVPVALYPVHVPCTCLQCGVHISHGRILIDHQNLLLWGKEQEKKKTGLSKDANGDRLPDSFAENSRVKHFSESSQSQETMILCPG